MKATTGLAAVVLLALGAMSTAGAATALQGQISIRPLTPSEIKDYSLTGAQGASGLSNVGLGQPAYLDALVNNAIPSSTVTVTWVLTNRPAGSSAALVTSPLGTNVPTYRMADRLSLQVAGRTMLRPDVTGQYTVIATITSVSNGTASVSQTINAATYMGVNTCALCHSGGLIASNTVTPWSQTAHSTFFTRAIDGLESDHYGANCISCHTVGYDANTNAVNGGFDDVAKTLGWTFPAVLTNGNWAAMPAALKNLGNIQCENCHGPGSGHAYGLGDTNLIAINIGVGDCAQCHDSKPNHAKVAEWNNSMHAVMGSHTSASCSRCHTGQGFINFISDEPAVSVPYEVVTCSACHDPHDASHPHQLRTSGPVTLMDNKTTISTNTAGAGIICMECHMSRRDATNYVDTTTGSGGFGPHHGPQTDMFEGVNAITYGKDIPSSAHRDAVEDTCVACHMQAVGTTDPSFTHAGGHTFGMSWNTGTNTLEMVAACQECHGPSTTTFDFPRQDYDGNGVVEGVQTEVHHLLDKLAYLLPPAGTWKSSISIDSSWSKQQLSAAYNYQFVLEDGSFGVHNLAYAVGLLKASIADLSGDANNDGIADWWQIQYFGSITNVNAAPSATPAGDGVPNWLKYSLGLDPTIPGVTVPDGVVWANGSALGGGTNTIHIYTAAEVVFDTQTNKNYQIQATSGLSSGWQNVGTPIAGTGNAMSYVTPTRYNVQQFYRVLGTP